MGLGCDWEKEGDDDHRMTVFSLIRSERVIAEFQKAGLIQYRYA